MTMTKHEHDDNCPWCQERAERKHDKGRMDAMAKAFLELNDCNLNGSVDDVNDRVGAILDQLHPHAIDGVDVLILAAKFNRERADKLDARAEWLCNYMEFADDSAPGPGETIQ